MKKIDLSYKWKIIILVILLIFLVIYLVAFSLDWNSKKAANILKQEVTETGDGLYLDKYQKNRYIYRGINPKNYIMFSDELWRIVSVESDDSIKIVKNSSIGNYAFGTLEKKGFNGLEPPALRSCNNWVNPSTLNRYLNDKYLKTLKESDLIVSKDWFIGASDGGIDLSKQISMEKSKKWNGKVGLITVSDYIQSNNTGKKCLTDKILSDDLEECKSISWIFKLIDNNDAWTITVSKDNTFSVWSIFTSGNIAGHFAANEYAVYPSVYLKSNITIEGNGTKNNPYKIKKI